MPGERVQGIQLTEPGATSCQEDRFVVSQLVDKTIKLFNKIIFTVIHSCFLLFCKSGRRKDVSLTSKLLHISISSTNPSRLVG